MSYNLKDFFLNLLMEQLDYTRINFKYPPPPRNYITIQFTRKNIQIWLRLHQNQKRNLLFETKFSISIQQLSKNIASIGYITCKYSKGLWQHGTREKCLCINYFGVKYFPNTKADHLMNTLKRIQNIYGPRREELMQIDH